MGNRTKGICFVEIMVSGMLKKGIRRVEKWYSVCFEMRISDQSLTAGEAETTLR